MNVNMFVESLLIGIGLSMDAFAVAVVKGLSMRKVRIKEMLIIALYFGGFQGLMPTVGWLLGTQFRSLIAQYDHWIAFGLLALIGGKMLIEAIRNKKEEAPGEMDPPLKHGELLVLALATSIDALAVGVSYAALGTAIFPPNLIIGVTTFLLSILGVVIGNKFGNKFERAAQIIGGVILVFIGVKVLVEHLIQGR